MYVVKPCLISQLCLMRCWLVATEVRMKSLNLKCIKYQNLHPCLMKKADQVSSSWMCSSHLNAQRARKSLVPNLTCTWLILLSITSSQVKTKIKTSWLWSMTCLWLIFVLWLPNEVCLFSSLDKYFARNSVQIFIYIDIRCWIDRYMYD